MSALELDDTDRAVAAALMEDGRATAAWVARRVGISESAARARVAWLLESGALRVAADPAPAAFGITVVGSLSMRVAGAARGVAERLAALDEVVLSAVVVGSFDVIAEFECRSAVELGALLEQVREIPGIIDLNCSSYLESVKGGRRRRPRPDEVSVDDVDRVLLRMLVADARASGADLARGLGLSPAATRVRLHRLLDDGIVEILTVPGDAFGPRVAGGAALRTEGQARPIAEAFAAFPETEWVVTTTGAGAVEMLLVAPTLSGLRQVLDRMHAVPGVRAVESCVYVEIVKGDVFS